MDNWTSKDETKYRRLMTKWKLPRPRNRWPQAKAPAGLLTNAWKSVPRHIDRVMSDYIGFAESHGIVNVAVFPAGGTLQSQVRHALGDNFELECVDPADYK